MSDALKAWRDSPSTTAIVDFVGRVTADGPDHVPPAERVAVFDNDGTLWCEKPAYVQFDFIVRSLAAAAAADSSLLAQPAFRAAHDGDLDWFGTAIGKHYDGDDTLLHEFVHAVLQVAGSVTTDDQVRRVADFFATAEHPVLKRPYQGTGYAPMVELLRYLEDNDFTCYIVSGGGRDFMRVVAEAMYSIPPERVLGSSVGVTYEAGTIVSTDTMNVINDGPVKPAQIWTHVGRRPILAAGNSNGDIEMLEYATSGPHPGLALLIDHDDAEREFAYSTGAERALDRAASDGWTTVSMARDWESVFGD